MNHTVIYGIGSAIQSLINFAFLPLFTKFLTTEEFGIYSLVLLIGTFAGAFFFFGASSALSRFYFDDDTIQYKKNAIATAFNITIFGVICQIVLGFVFATQLSILLTNKPIYSRHIILMFVASSLGIIQNLLLLILRLEKKSRSFILATISGASISLLVIVYFLAYKNQGIYAPILGLLSGNAVTILFCLLFVTSKLHFSINISAFKTYIAFGIPTVLNGLAYYLLDWLDRFMIKAFGSLSDVGIYSMGYKIGMVIYILFITPFAMIWSTMRMQYAKQSNYDQMTTKVVSYFTLVGITITLLLSLFAKEILILFSGNNAYLVSYKVVPWVMMACLINGYGNILDYGIYREKKFHYYYIILIVSCVINAILNYLFIPKLGYIAAAYATFITYLFYIIVLYIVSNKYYNIKVEWARVLSLYVFAFGLLFLASTFPFNDFICFILKIILFISAIIVTFLRWLTAQERKLVFDTLNKMKGKLFTNKIYKSAE